MSKGKECNDIINTAKINTDFSYKNTRYFKQYVILYKPFSLNDNGSFNILHSKNINGTLEIGRNIYLNNNGLYELEPYNPDEIISTINDDDKKEIAENLAIILDSENLENLLKESISKFEDFIKILEEQKEHNNLEINLDFFNELLSKAKRQELKINTEQSKVLTDYSKMNYTVLANILLKKTFDIIFGCSGGTMSPLTILKSLKFIPYIGLFFILLDVASLIYEMYKGLKANRFAKEYGLIKSFYSHLTYELSSVILNSSDNSDIFYKYKLNSSYGLRLYNCNIVDNMQTYSLFGNKGINANNLVITVDIDKDLYEETLMLSTPECKEVYTKKCVQLSTLYNEKAVISSSYFQHIKNLIYNANKITFIQTGNFSSLFLVNMLSSSYINNNERINKYTVVVSHAQDVNSHNHRNQRYTFDTMSKNIGNNSLVMFPVRNIKIDDFYYMFVKTIDIYIKNIYASYIEAYKRRNELLNSIGRDKITEYLDNLYIFYVSKILLDHWYGKNYNINSDKNDLIKKAKYFFNIPVKNNFNIDYLYSLTTKYSNRLQDLSSKSYYQPSMAIIEGKNREDMRDYPYIRKFWKSISDMHVFINNIKLFTSFYYNPVLDEELEENLTYTITKEHKFIDNFYSIENFEDKNNNSLSFYIKKNEILKGLFKQVVSTEYGKDYKYEQNILYSKFSAVIGNSDNVYSGLQIYIQRIYDLYYVPYLDILNKELCQCFHLEFNEFFDKILAFIYDDIESKLPINKARLYFAFDNMKYYNRLCEYIFSEYIGSLNNGMIFLSSFLLYYLKNDLFILNRTISSLIEEQGSSFEKIDEKIDEYITYYKEKHKSSLDKMYFDIIFLVLTVNISSHLHSDAIYKQYSSDSKSSLDIFDKGGIVDKLFANYLKEKIPGYIEVNDVECVVELGGSIKGFSIDGINMDNYSSIKDLLKDISIIINIPDTNIKAFKVFQNLSGVYLTALEITDRDVFKAVSGASFEELKEKVYNYQEMIRNPDTRDNAQIPESLRKSGKISNIPKALKENLINSDFSKNLYKLIVSCIKLNADDYAEIEQELLEKIRKERIQKLLYDIKRISNKNLGHDAFVYVQNAAGRYVLKINPERSRSVAVNSFMQNHAGSRDIYRAAQSEQDFHISKRDVSRAYRRELYKPLKEALVRNSKNFALNTLYQVKSELFSRKGVLGIAVNITIDALLPAVDFEEYEAKRKSIEYAYLHRRADIPGAYWNKEKGYFTIPVQINQNFIMSDFRAMVVGGAHFDNSCFIKGTSSGIFVQDNKNVSKSFLEIMIDYLDVIELNDVDKKMGRYLLAYCNVINYLYQLSMVHNNCSNRLNKLFNRASSILSSVGMSFGNGVIKQVKEKPNETSEPINNNYYVQTDNFLMKDFVIQLKHFGESNYKFYHTQEETQNRVPDNKKVGKANSVKKDNKEVPLLLGSLLYDENWFKSTVDNENQEV